MPSLATKYLQAAPKASFGSRAQPRTASISKAFGWAAKAQSKTCNEFWLRLFEGIVMFSFKTIIGEGCEPVDVDYHFGTDNEIVIDCVTFEDVNVTGLLNQSQLDDIEFKAEIAACSLQSPSKYDNDYDWRNAA